MTRFSKYGPLASALIVVAATLGCGGSQNTSGSGGGSFGSASLRVVVLNPTAGAVNVSVDGAMVSSNLLYLGNTGYVPIKAGGAGQLDIETSNSVAVGPVKTTLNLPANSRSTFLLDGWAHFESSSCMLTDDSTPAPNSAAKLRIMDASLAVLHDIYLLPAGSTPSGTPLVTLSAFNNATSYQVLAPGAYEVFFTKAGTTQVLFDSGTITLAANQNRTVIVLSDCQPNTCNFNILTSITLADLN
ncbi:MAG: DUF4397 domain-containing protein [Candidatus Angelobacter sp.]